MAADAAVVEMQRLGAVFYIGHNETHGWHYAFEAPAHSRPQCQRLAANIRRQPEPAYSLFKVAVWVAIMRARWGL